MFQHFATQLNTYTIQSGSYVLYWMQATQRTEWNHALEYAMHHANKLKQPLIVYFGLTHYPEANLRHYHFMLEGLKEVASSLAEQDITFILTLESPEQGVLKYAKDASLCVVDVGYLKTEKRWRKDAAKNMRCPLIQIESNVIVPVKIASPKEEYAAATFRPKITKQLDKFLRPISQTQTNQPSRTRHRSTQLNFEKPEEILSQLALDVNVKPVHSLHGGTAMAKSHLQKFITTCLDDYHVHRNDPSRNLQSNMSPYLHFGQISPLFIAIQIQSTESPGKAAYLEELIVRRELSINYVHYNPHYDTMQGLPRWAQRTLHDHSTDPREYNYPLDTLEHATTHDPYWNAAQQEMMITGKMHGYMRMYWGKKILEWSTTPEQAFSTALYLNNKYELDGRDPNSYTGIAWCFGKHDRPWKERAIYGKVRYMNDRGLQRKFNIDQYVHHINHLS